MTWLKRRGAVQTDVEEPVEDAWTRHVGELASHSIEEPGSALRHRPVTEADAQALYDVTPSLADYLPWVEYLPDSQSLLLEDGQSVAAFFELTPIGTEGREPAWFSQARDAVENALQDSFEEFDENPWVVQLYAQDEADWSHYLRTLAGYVQPRAQGSAFSEFYLRFFSHHLRAIAKPGGLFEDTAVTRLPWRGQLGRVRMVVYRRTPDGASRRGQSPEQALTTVCDRLAGGLANAGVQARRLDVAALHDWLFRWFNPHPTMLGPGVEDRERFYALTRYPEASDENDIELASGDFAQRLFFGQPRSDVDTGTWWFDGLPHRVVVMDRLRQPPSTGHLTGETRKGGDAVNALFDQMPEDTVMCLTLVATPQDVLEAHLNHLSRKAVGETLASEQTRQDVQQARRLIGSAHKLYRGALAFYLRGRDLAQLDARGVQLANVMLNAGLQPVREDDEVAPLNSYLRWLPAVFDPAADRRQWYTQLMFVQHAANLAPLWGRSRVTGHPGITLFNRGGDRHRAGRKPAVAAYPAPRLTPRRHHDPLHDRLPGVLPHAGGLGDQQRHLNILVASGLFALPFIAIVVQEWLRARTEGADEGNKGVLSSIRVENRVWVAIVVIMFAGIPFVPVSLQTLQFDATRSEQCQVTVAQPAATGWSNAYTTLNNQTALVPVWWFFMHAISKAVTASAVAAIPCGTDLRQIRMEVDATRINDPLLAQEIADFVHDCYGPARAKLFMNRPALSDAQMNDVTWIGSTYFRDTAGFYDNYHASTPRAGWPYDATRDAGLAQAESGGGYPTCRQWWSDAGQGLRPRLIAQVDPDLLTRIGHWAGFLSQDEVNDAVVRSVVSPRQQKMNQGAVYADYGGQIDKTVPKVVTRGAGDLGMTMGALGIFPAMDVVRQALPMVLSLLKMALVVCIPLVLVVGTYELKAVVTVSCVEFALFFVDFWFQLARWLDSTILDALYGWGFGWNRPHSNFDPLIGLNNGFEDMLLTFVMATMFIVLPGFWVAALSWVGVRAGAAIQALGAGTKDAHAAGGKGAGIALRAIK